VEKVVQFNVIITKKEPEKSNSSFKKFQILSKTLKLAAK
jgi:hypothetical protein